MKHNLHCKMEGIGDSLKVVSCSPNLKPGLAVCEKENQQV